MISFWAGRDQNCLTVKSPLSFFVNLFKKKKYKVRKSHVKKSDSNKSEKGSREVPNVLSVSVMDMRMSSPCPLSPSLSVLTLTPGRTRDIDQDMEALRLSRQDNPFLQVLASRESLVESLFESESDDTNLMSQEFPNDLEVDPFSLPEIHEHMIRSPPPTTWPKSPNFKVFRFPAPDSQENLQVNNSQSGISKMKSSSKVLFSGMGKDGDKATPKDLRFIDAPENCLRTHSMLQSINSPRCEECNGYPVVRPTSVKPQLGSSTANNSADACQDRKLDGKYDEEMPLTLPLLSKKFT